MFLIMRSQQKGSRIWLWRETVSWHAILRNMPAGTKWIFFWFQDSLCFLGKHRDQSSYGNQKLIMREKEQLRKYAFCELPRSYLLCHSSLHKIQAVTGNATTWIFLDNSILKMLARRLNVFSNSNWVCYRVSRLDRMKFWSILRIFIKIVHLH